jgi:glutamine cyclotransferase
MDFVLNGIAYDENADDLYITGKNWPLIFIYRGLFG